MWLGFARDTKFYYYAPVLFVYNLSVKKAYLYGGLWEKQMLSPFSPGMTFFIDEYIRKPNTTMVFLLVMDLILTTTIKTNDKLG